MNIGVDPGFSAARSNGVVVQGLKLPGPPFARMHSRCVGLRACELRDTCRNGLKPVVIRDGWWNDLYRGSALLTIFTIDPQPGYGTVAFKQNNVQGTIKARLIFKCRFLFVLQALLEDRDTQGNPILDKRFIVVEFSTPATVVIQAYTELAEVAVVNGLFGCVIDNSSGTSDTEQERVGAATDGDTPGVIAVKRNIRQIQITRQICRKQTPDPLVCLRIGSCIHLEVAAERRLRSSGKISLKTAHFNISEVG